MTKMNENLNNDEDKSLIEEEDEELTTEEVLEKYMSQENMHLEGRRGFEDLCKIARVLGYKDSMYFGSLQNGAHIGDLIEFFEDNMGALNAVVEWITDQDLPEWKKAIEDELEPGA